MKNLLILALFGVLGFTGTASAQKATGRKQSLTKKIAFTEPGPKKWTRAQTMKMNEELELRTRYPQRTGETFKGFDITSGRFPPSYFN